MLAQMVCDYQRRGRWMCHLLEWALGAQLRWCLGHREPSCLWSWWRVPASVCLRKQQMWAQVTGSRWPVWKSWMAFQAPSFSVAQLWLLRTPREWTRDWDLLLSLSALQTNTRHQERCLEKSQSVKLQEYLSILRSAIHCWASMKKHEVCSPVMGVPSELFFRLHTCGWYFGLDATNFTSWPDTALTTEDQKPARNQQYCVGLLNLTPLEETAWLGIMPDPPLARS